MTEHEHTAEDHVCLADLVTREQLSEAELAELESASEGVLVASAEDAEATADVQAQGITVRHDWRTANYGPGPMRYPIGIMLHHTAGRRGGDLPTLTRRGTGVSANAYITKDGTIFVLAPFPRRAWHAGLADRGTGYVRDGNTWYYGIEIENLGNGRDPYTNIQIDAIVAHCRWLCEAHNITHPGAMIRHRDFAPSRKIDTSDNFPFQSVRNRTFARGSAPEQPSKPAPEKDSPAPEYERVNFLSHGAKDAKVSRAASDAMNKIARQRDMKEDFAKAITHHEHITYVSGRSAEAEKGQLISVVCGLPARKHLSSKVDVIGTLEKTDILDGMGDTYAQTIEKVSWRVVNVAEYLGFGAQEQNDVIASYDRDTRNLV